MKVIILLLLPLSLQAQINRNWIFGDKAGLSFPGPVPTGLHSMITQEGVATMSDVSGNLLFYTDGVTVWNRLGIVMSNGTGLVGDGSSTQSSVIFEMIGQSGRYYIFTAPEGATTNPIAYSIVDMSLNGGLGDVTIKNVPLYTPSCEKITIVRHCNNRDAWLISHDKGTNVYRVWPITSLGIGAPVTSAVGVVVSSAPLSASQGYGYLKSNLQGNKLSVCHYGLNRAVVVDFNNLTGGISNEITTSPTSLLGPYGTEFSPDGTIVYYTYNNGNQIRQFDLCTNTGQNIATNLGVSWGAMQLQDNRIYIVRRNIGALSTINQPNVLGPGCLFLLNNVPLLLGSFGRFGLPNFSQYYTRWIQPFSYIINCNEVEFTMPYTTTCNFSSVPVSVLWKFGDGIESPLNNPTHIYSSDGTYTVQLIMNFTCYSDTSEAVISIPGLDNFPVNTNQ
jgi:hypothetical protein